MSFLSNSHPSSGRPKQQKPSLTLKRDRFTPTRYINAAQHVLGDIDLDPASCAAANQIVQAARFFTEADDSLTQTWHARSVWLNPPDGRINGKSGQERFSRKLIDEYAAGHVETAILLVDAVTDRPWFRTLWHYPICFTNHRITFVGSIPGQAKQRARSGNAFVYFGPNIRYFSDVFRMFGHVTGGAAW